MAAKLNRAKTFDTVHGANADGAQTMQVQEGKVRYFGADDCEVGGEAQAVTVKTDPKAEPQPEPKRRPKPAVETEDAQLDLQQQLTRNLV